MWGGPVRRCFSGTTDNGARLSDRRLELVADQSARRLEIALGHRGQMHRLCGELAWPRPSTTPSKRRRELTGGPLAPYHRLGLVAMHGGGRSQTVDRRGSCRRDRARRGSRFGVHRFGRAMLYNGLGHLSRPSRHPAEFSTMRALVPANSALPELVGQPREPEPGWPETPIVDWRNGVERGARLGLGGRGSLRALLRRGRAGDDLYAEAISDWPVSRRGRPRPRTPALRKWLQHQSRRVDARNSCASRTRCSPTSAWKRSSNARGVELEARTSTPVHGPSSTSATSRHRRHWFSLGRARSHDGGARRSALRQPERRRFPPFARSPAARRQDAHSAREPRPRLALPRRE